jgi:vacuolar-type H+-ATPase subunit I/STV1
MSALNFLHFKKRLEFFFEFLPQLCFMLSIFGYMCFLIFLKWSTDFEHFPPPTLQGNSAPSILNLMIQMFLSPSPSTLRDEFHLYPGQPGIQLILILIALVSVPLMLFVKPYYLKALHAKKDHARLLPEAGDHLEGNADAHGGEHGGGHDGHGGEVCNLSHLFHLKLLAYIVSPSSSFSLPFYCSSNSVKCLFINAFTPSSSF